MPTGKKVKFRPYISKDLCKRCGICIHFCPRNVLQPGDGDYPSVMYPEKCHGCFMCFLRCPDFALEVIRSEGQ